MKPVLAASRAVADQRCRCTESDDVGVCRLQFRGARPGLVCHGNGRVGAAGLTRRKAEEALQRLFAIGNLDLDQQLGPAWHP